MSNTVNTPPVIAQPAPPPERRSKKSIFKRWWFWATAILGLVIVIIAANSGGSENSAGSDPGGSVPDAAPADDANVGIGEPAADGNFTFTVQGIDCSAATLGQAPVSTTAQGVFCILDVSLENTGDEAQSFFGDNQILFNAEGQEFSSSSSAAIYLEDSNSLYAEVNPGNTLVSKVIFDVPAGTVPTAVELHDSALSGGVTVDLQ